jgi:hypothetical protein
MTDTFPLYDSLSKDLPKVEMNNAIKEEVISMINKLDQNGMNLLYVIIIIFSKKNQTKAVIESIESNKIVFKGKKDVNSDMTCNFKWNFNDLPVKLKYIIHKFLKLHLSTMQEEQNRSQTKEQYDSKNQ